MKSAIPPEAYDGLGRLVARLFDVRAEALATLGEGLEVEGVSVVFDWEPTGEQFTLTLNAGNGEGE